VPLAVREDVGGNFCRLLESPQRICVFHGLEADAWPAVRQLELVVLVEPRRDPRPRFEIAPNVGQHLEQCAGRFQLRVRRERFRGPPRAHLGVTGQAQRFRNRLLEVAGREEPSDCLCQGRLHGLKSGEQRLS
jgi:hypothetical protein